MSDKLSPKDFDSITEWIKQYIGTEPEPTEQLLSPIIAVKSNTHTELIYTVNNPNEVDAYFNGDLISAKGQSELTHIWNEDSFTISGNLTAKGYIASDTATLTVERAPDTIKVTATISTVASSSKSGIGFVYKVQHYMTCSGITLNKMTINQNNNIKYTNTFMDADELYYIGAERNYSMLTGEQVASDSKVPISAVYTVGSKPSSFVTIRSTYYFGKNTVDETSAPVYSSDPNIFTIPLNATINYTYNGKTAEKDINITLELDISSLNGKDVWSNMDLGTVEFTI